ncbi:SAC3/GANP/Nin1/mts3/eIF-3 p25 family-domain-containing protein [Phlebopus sp. FC_14]|nr:SAC3/GANP/Nin1/mts3/eIF-3 p25 family-domain-containing protein [Phlebopus sp. FC_14]
MEPTIQRQHRGRANGIHHDSAGLRGRAHHKNKQWVAEGGTGRSGATTPHTGSDGERWERGGPRGGRGRGRGGRGKFPNASVTFRRVGGIDGETPASEGEHSEMEDETEVDEREPETQEEREKFWQELVKAREVERKRAIAEGKMDDPLVPKRLEDAITMVGTCLDMCPRFERYRRERENNLFEWETIPGTKRVDHKRAVKMYERAAGDKTLPSDLRPPKVLQRTLDYLFHDLLPRGGFSATFSFIRDRSRAVRNDFTMQHEMGPIAIECHDRCARFHILALHIERDQPGFSIALEEQQLMNTLQSLKEFYQEHRGSYQSPTELEMRVYHRLIHIRDQKERHDDIPRSLLSHPVFELTSRFRSRVQANSAPITKTSPLTVDADAMQIFSELAGVLRREGNVVMTYLIACILERLFGKDTIEDIESIRGNLSLPDIIDGYSGIGTQDNDTDVDVTSVGDAEESHPEDDHSLITSAHPLQGTLQPSGTQWLNEMFGPKPTESAFFSGSSANVVPQSPPGTEKSAFSDLTSVPNAFSTPSFGVTGALKTAVSVVAPVSVFGSAKDGSTSIFGPPTASSSMSFSPFVPAATQTSSPNAPPVFAPDHPQITTFGDAFDHQTAQLSPPSTSPQGNGTSRAAHGPRLFPPILNSQAPVSTSEKSGILIASNSVNPAPNGTEQIRSPPASVAEPLLRRRRSDEIHESVSVSSPSPIPQVPVQRHDTPSYGASLNGTSSHVPAPSSVSLPLFGVIDEPLSKLEPTNPPPLNRRHPISLPPTPTATVFIPPSMPTKQKSIFGSLGSIQTSSLSAVPTEILSPLVLNSPGASRSFPCMPNLLRRDSMQSPLRASISAADNKASNDIAHPLQLGKPTLAIMKPTALNFSRGSWLVRESFSRWRQRLADRVRWMEACQRSNTYSEKVQAERLSRSTGSLPPEKSRRIDSSETRAPLRKRLKNRLSGEYRPPQNDEELARRFEKNHEEHARRWSRGSFLRILKNFLNSASNPLPDNWFAWLSLNQENDGTAIWLEQKFDVPNSGKWRNENVFQIPLSRDHTNVETCYPGVVLFERTPLTSMSDLLEKKYRVLEDCARLREIVQAFSPNRHYVPSLICISWSRREPDVSTDFDDMVTSMIGGGMFASSHELFITTAVSDMESKLEELLRVVTFDYGGRLVQWSSLNDLFDIWKLSCDEMTARWLDNCITNGRFQWDLHIHVLEGCERFSMHIIDVVIALLRGDASRIDLPHLQIPGFVDSDATFSAVLTWLESLPPTSTAVSLINDIKAHQSMCREFPTTSFSTQVYALARSIAAHVANVDPDVSYRVSRARLEEATHSILDLRASLESDMRAHHMAGLRASSKRLASYGESTSSSSMPAKKRRLSTSDGSIPSDDGSPPLTSHQPSPSLSTATSLQSVDRSSLVTSAMLRTLTRDILAKYTSDLSSASR